MINTGQNGVQHVLHWWLQSSVRELFMS